MSTPGPVLGPCTSWATGEEVAACCSGFSGSDPSELDEYAVIASQALFEVSGRQFAGGCERVVRPCRTGCGCWGQILSRGHIVDGGWYWSGTSWGCGGDTCGCGFLSRVRLAGYPVREVTEVKLDGVVLDPSEYRLDSWRFLVRLNDTAWPACQDLSLDSDQPGTFEVTYEWGVDPPSLAVQAAAELACQLYAACNSEAGDCALPSGVVQIVRQGVTYTRQFAQSLFAGRTGLANVDTFMAVYGQVDGKTGQRRRRPAVYSPDLQPFAKRVGN
jgi:hypothetical protein